MDKDEQQKQLQQQQQQQLQQQQQQLQGPWRATRLWNSIIRTFRAEMPLKKHKKNMRTYENCFSSTEAVDFLHKHLQKNPNFGTEVSKEQTVQLLKKLYRAGIIENVREDSTDEEFKVDNLTVLQILIILMPFLPVQVSKTKT